MSIRVRTNFDGLNHKTSPDSLKRGRIAAANDALQAMNTHFVPMLHTDSNTNLRSESKVSDDGETLTWTAVYARAQFYGFVGKAPGHRVYKYTTPGTSRRWDLRLKSRDDLMGQVSDAFFKGAEWHG
jgi:hypothetical protein